MVEWLNKGLMSMWSPTDGHGSAPMRSLQLSVEAEWTPEFFSSGHTYHLRVPESETEVAVRPLAKSR